MSDYTPHTRDPKQAWCLYGVADSPADVRLSERRLSRELGHQPCLREVVEDLMARHHIARPFTEPASSPTPRPTHDTGAR